MRPRSSLFWLLSLLIFPCFCWGMDGMLQPGYGAKSLSMGGVGVALPMDAFAPAANPAGLPWVCNRFDAEINFLRHDGQYRFEPLPFTTIAVPTAKRRMVSHFVWPEAAVALRLNRWFSFGFAAFAVGGWKTAYKQPDPLFGTSSLGSTFAAYYFTPSIALRIGCVHSFGLSVNIAEAYFSAQGLELFTTRSVAPNRVTNQGRDHSVGVSVRVGWMGQLLPCLSLGLTYQTETWLTRFSTYSGFLPEGRLNLPAQLGAGLAWRFHPLMLLAVDVVDLFWSHARHFDNSSDFDAPFGSSHGPSFGWRNQLVFKLGVEWDIVERLTIRAGFNHVNTPMFLSSTFINVLTQETIKETLTVGATHKRGCNEFTIYYLHGFGHHVAGESSVLTVRQAALVRLRGRQDAFGFSWGRKF